MGSSAGVPQSIRREVMARDGYRCQNGTCGIRGTEIRSARGDYSYPTAKPGVSLTIDHVIPRALGGSSRDPRNLRVLCTSCNSRKGKRVVAAGSREV